MCVLACVCVCVPTCLPTVRCCTDGQNQSNKQRNDTIDSSNTLRCQQHQQIATDTRHDAIERPSYKDEERQQRRQHQDERTWDGQTRPWHVRIHHIDPHAIIGVTNALDQACRPDWLHFFAAGAESSVLCFLTGCSTINDHDIHNAI